MIVDRPHLWSLYPTGKIAETLTSAFDKVKKKNGSKMHIWSHMKKQKLPWCSFMRLKVGK